MSERDWLLPGKLWREGTGLVGCHVARRGGALHEVTVTSVGWHGVWCNCRGFAFNHEQCQHLALGGLTAQIWTRVLKLRADGTMSLQSVEEVDVRVTAARARDAQDQRAELRAMRDELMSWRGSSEG